MMTVRIRSRSGHRRLLAIIAAGLLTLLMGCGSSDSGTGDPSIDAAADARPADSARDQQGLPPLTDGAPPPPTDSAPPPPADSAPPPADGATPPPADGAPPPPVDGATVGPDPGPVQCRDDADCGPGLSCNRAAPGGICLGCAPGTCPDSLLCLVGACVRECADDSQCSAGLRCSSLGRCLVRSCSATTPCPAPYTCGANSTCERPACGGGAPACPAPLLCDAQRCIEP